MADVGSVTGRVGAYNTPTTEVDATVSGAVGSKGLESSSTSKETEKAVGGDVMGKDEFLQLLITSLRYQDPLEPAGNEEFIAQVAQFSSLENSVNMTSSIDKLASGLEGLIADQKSSAQLQSNASAVSMLGKKVRLDVSKVDFDGSRVEFSAHVNSNEMARASIVDSDGNVINTVLIPNTYENSDGEIETYPNGDRTGLSWDGLSVLDGKTAENGAYTIQITSMNGSQDDGYVYVENSVTGISYEPEGVMLEVGGNKMSMSDVMYVTEGAEKDDKNIVETAVDAVKNAVTGGETVTTGEES
jgi:flagellar basal-body rod modification protein FlgD